MLDPKEFDHIVGALRFAIPALWRAQGTINASHDKDIAELTARLDEAERRIDILTRNLAGAVAASEAEAKQ